MPEDYNLKRPSVIRQTYYRNKLIAYNPSYVSDSKYLYGDNAESEYYRLAAEGSIVDTQGSTTFVNPKDFGAVGNGSVDDTTAVNAAIASAFSTNNVVYWPGGSYKVTANVVNMHKVRHRGNGYILRDGLVFFPEPKSTNKNTLYVAPTGVTTNDGLTPGFPMDVQSALNTFENYGPTLGGYWVVQHAAGTYPGGYSMPYMDNARRAIEIRGVNMGGFRVDPTVIYDRGVSPTIAWGFITANMKINFYDIKFLNFNLYDHTVDGNNSGGIRLDAYSDSLLWNIHVDTADFGVYALTHTKYGMVGCYIKNCQMGVTELWCVIRSTSGDFASRNVIENCFYGLKAKELCTGHGDWNEYLDCDYAIHMSRSSTINSSYATFKRNLTMFVMSGHSAFVDLYLTFSMTGADANGVFCRYMNGVANMRAGAENYLSSPYIGMTEKSFGYGKAVAHTNTLSDTQLVPLGVFNAGDFQGEGAWIRWVSYGTANMTSATTLLRLRIGGTTGISITLPTGSYDWKFEGRMYVTTQGNIQQINGWLSRTNGNPLSSRASRTVDFAGIAYGFGLFAQLGGLSDTITVDQAVLFTSDL